MQPPEPADFVYLFEDDETITEEDALEYFTSLMTVLQGFIDLGFDINSIHSYLPHNAVTITETPGNAVESGDTRTRFETAAISAERGEE